MKCPKCKYVSFEHLNFCKKCGVELSSHKAEHSIDFPQTSDLGVLTMVEVSAESEIAEQAMAVAEEGGGETDLQESVETGVEEASEAGGEEASGLDLSSLGESVEETASIETIDTGESGSELELPSDEAVEAATPDDSGSLDLSDMGGSTEEIASISLDDTEQESGGSVELAVTDEEEGIALGEEGEISLDIGDLDEKEEPAAAIAEEKEGGDISLDIDDIGEADIAAEEVGGEGISLDLDSFEVDEEPVAGLDSGEPEITGEDEAATDEDSGTEEIEDLDLGGIDIEETGSGESETPDAQPEAEADDDISLDDLDLDLNLDEDELLGGDESSSDEDDIDLEDLNLDDLKLDDD